MAHPAELREPSSLVDTLFALTIAALFSGIHQRVGPVKVQLSDILAAVTIFFAVWRGCAAPRASGPVVLLVVAYLLLYCMSAFFVDVATGIRESVQAPFMLALAFVGFGFYRTRPTDRLLKLGSLLVLVVLVYNIRWHIAHGRYVGWKELNEPKTIFMLLPLLLILLIDRFGDRRRALFFVASILAAVVILMSGERKAYLFGLVALIVWTLPISWRHIAVAGVLIPVLWTAVAYDRTGYLQRQVNSFSDILPGKGATQASATMLMDGSRPTTLSNSQREFAKRFAEEAWRKKPVFGVGTTANRVAMEKEVSLPKIFRQGVHGEFHRTLYENGIVGLAIYVAAWMVALVQIAIAWRATRAAGDSGRNRIKLICLMMFLIYCGSEGGKGLTLLCLCMLPFIVALQPRTGRSTSVASSESGVMSWQIARG